MGSMVIIDGFEITGGNVKYVNTDIDPNLGIRFAGGGILNNGVVRNCIIRGNKTEDHGGGVYNRGIIENCIISNNSASLEGGGIYNCGDIFNTTIQNNSAGLMGDNLATKTGEYTMDYTKSGFIVQDIAWSE